MLASAILALTGCAPPPRAASPAAFVFPTRLIALGTEPFWSIAIDDDRIVYSDPEKSPIDSRVTRRDSGGVLLLEGTLAQERIIIRLIPQVCSDGMSDRSYGFTATVELGTRLLNGCAS